MVNEAMDRVIRRIDESVAINGPLLRDETFAYILNHESMVVDQLRERQYANIPTSFGYVQLSMADLEAVVV